QFSACHDDVNPALASTVSLLQKPAFGVVETPHSAIDGQRDKLPFHQADHRLGPVGRRTAPRTSASANTERGTPTPTPDQDWLALRGGFLASFPDVEKPGDLLEPQLPRPGFD